MAMRSLGPTSQAPGSGRGAAWALVPVGVGAVLALALAVCGTLGTEGPGPGAFERPGLGESREAVTLARGASRQQPGGRFQGVGSDTWAAVLGAPAASLPHPVLVSARGRGASQPAPLAVARWGRERQVPEDTAVARRVRYPVVPPSAMGIADRPPLVTRPLRGPPARG